MKFFIDSYSNPVNSTQSMYFHHHINAMEEHESYITSPSLPLFDTLYAFGPDVYITSAKTLRWDYVEYIKDTGSEIKTFISLDDTKLGNIHSVVETLKENNIKARFFLNGSTQIGLKSLKISTIPILPAIDSNLNIYFNESQRYQWKNKIDYLIVSSSVENLHIPSSIGNNSTFHIYSSDGKGDLLETIVTCNNELFHNYHNIIFDNLDLGVSQMFLQAIMSGTPTYYFDPNGNHDEMLSRILKTEQTLNWLDKSKVTDFSDIRKHIQEKHKSENRVKSLLSQLPQVCHA